MSPAPLDHLGKFELREMIGEGAMGTIWNAYDTVLNRHVAVKLLASNVGKTREMRDRFLQEARAAARLQHSYIVTVHDFGEHHGQLFIAMELVAGRDLSQIIERRDPLPLEEKLDMIIGALEGLAYAHSQGVVHRDMKPGNVRIQPDGKPKIMDFGIARLATSELTKAGTMMGTPTYMAPEQITNDAVTPATDIFSVGAMLYELLSYHKPFEAETLEGVLYQVLSTDPPPLRTLAPTMPAALERVVTKAMAKSPRDRYQDAGEMITQLRSIRCALPEASQAVTAVVRGPWTWIPSPLLRLLRGVPVAARLAVVGALGLVALLTVIVSLRNPRGAVTSLSSTPEAIAQEGGNPATTSPVSLVSVLAHRDAARASYQEAIAAGALKAAEEEMDTGRTVLQAADEALRQRVNDSAQVLYRSAAATFVHALEITNTLGQEARAAVERARTVAQFRGLQRTHGTYGLITRAESLLTEQEFVRASDVAKVAESQARGARTTRPTRRQTARGSAEPQIRQLLTRMAQALANENIERLRALYPSMSDEEVRQWESFFDAARSLSATFKVGEVRIEGDRAYAQVNWSYEFEREWDGQPREVRQSAQMQFIRSASGWLILAIVTANR